MSVSSRLGLALALALVAGCAHDHPLRFAEDPFAPPSDARLSRPKLFEVDWRNELVKSALLDWGQFETATPGVDEFSDRVLVCTRDGTLRGLDRTSGALVWSMTMPARCFAGPLVVPPAIPEEHKSGIAYLPGGDGVLYALWARTGEVLWKAKLGEELVTTPVLQGDALLVNSQADVLYAVNLSDGALRWQYKRDPPNGFSVRGASRPTVSQGVVYAGFSDGVLAALDLKTGAPKWEKKLARSGTQFLDVDVSPVVSGDRVYAASYKDGVYALAIADGSVLWQANKPGVTSLNLANDVLLYAGDGEVGGLEARTGKPSWAQNASDRGFKRRSQNAGREPLAARGMLFVPTATALAFMIPGNDGGAIRWNPGKGVTATPAYDGSRLYVLSNLGTLFALRLTGSFSE